MSFFNKSLSGCQKRKRKAEKDLKQGKAVGKCLKITDMFKEPGGKF